MLIFRQQYDQGGVRIDSALEHDTDTNTEIADYNMSYPATNSKLELGTRTSPVYFV